MTLDKIKLIEYIAENDMPTNDDSYNNGLRLILNHGYLGVCGHPDVRYWCECNNL